MLVTFTTDAYADITMFGDVAAGFAENDGAQRNRTQRNSGGRCASGTESINC